jgi:hypothetical protein
MIVAEFKPGDFVRLSKKGLTGSVGVVWQIHLEKAASVEVYWLAGENNTSSSFHETKKLELVLDSIPAYAVKLKALLFP